MLSNKRLLKSINKILYIWIVIENTLSSLQKNQNISYVVVSEVCDAPNYLLDNRFIKFDSKLLRQSVIVILLFKICLFFCQRDVMSISNNNQAVLLRSSNLLEDCWVI